MTVNQFDLVQPSQSQGGIKVNLLGLTRDQLGQFFNSIGEKPFRAKQVYKWIHQLCVTDFEQMTDLSKVLRAKLSELAEVRPPKIAFQKYSEDGTRKWVLDMEDENGKSSKVETVLIPDGQRMTLCVSSQVGCALDCSFCSTGKQGFQRDLSASEIIGQLWVANASFPVPEDAGKGKNKQKSHHNITNIVMMGMGEPLLNYDNVLAALNIMKDDCAYGISRRRLTVSTSGIVPAIDKLSEDIDVALALSLHAPNDELRNELVPVNKKYPLKEVLAACERYLGVHESQSHRSITIEYVLLNGVNDLPEHAEQMAKLLKGLPCKLNLIPFNPFPHSGYKKPSYMHIRKFQERLQQAGYITTVRSTRGDDIDAACGQLVGQVNDRTRRSKKWQEKIQLKQNG